MFDILRNESRDREQLAEDIRQALKAQAFHLAFQPIVDARSGGVLAAEALCRWRHPSRGDISPGVFIPIAEEAALVTELGEYVMRQACLASLDWSTIITSVNVSPQQFEQPDFVEKVKNVLRETGFPATRLELELTENLAITELDRARTKMEALQELGVRVALDDFGSGHSSLNYLLSLPFDKLKIDRAFISRLESGAASAAIIHAIVGIGRALGMHVTAEGVETAEQQLFLRVAGVHSFQGFRFSRPTSPAKISEWLARENAHVDPVAPPPLAAAS